MIRSYAKDGGRFVIFHSAKYSLDDLDLFLQINDFVPIIAYEDDATGECGIYAEVKQ